MYPWMIRTQRDHSDADLPVKLFSREPACCGRLLLYHKAADDLPQQM